MKEALFYKPVEKQRVLCYLCPRYCKINPGQTGFCFVRVNQGGKLYSLAYGAPFAVNVDPVEKKPLFHFLPGTAIFSLGTAGCNMGCKFCQNWDISKAKYDQERAFHLPPEKVVRLAKRYGCPSIAYTYNEPTIFAEYVMDTAALAHQEGIKNVMVTNGYITEEAFPEVYKHIDAANVDLKAFTEEFYRKITLSHLEPVLKTLKLLKENGIWFEITNLIIPGYNDNMDDIRRMCEWIRDELSPEVPVHFTAFHPDYKMRDVPPTPPRTLLQARKVGLETGLHYVYVGNILDVESSSTYCPKCQTMLIRRSWHAAEILNLKDGHCGNCGYKIAGVF